MIWTLQIKEKLKTLMKKFVPYGYLFPCVKFQGFLKKKLVFKNLFVAITMMFQNLGNQNNALLDT